jgi:hypothetical protein
MTQDQPVRESTHAAPEVDGLAAAASALAKRRWARVQESHETNQEAPEPADPIEETAPETEEPAEDTLESGLEEGQEGEEQGETEEETVAEEDSEEEQPAKALDLDSLDDDSEVVVDGKPITARELKESRMRLEDYTRKTQALASQREVITQREQLALYHLGKMQEGVQAKLEQFKNVDWMALAEKNPNEYQRQKALSEAAQRQAYDLEQEAQGFLQQVKQMEDSLAKEQAKVAQKELKERINGWNNALYYRLVEYAEKNGFDRKNVLKYTDPNIFVLLNKARAYDEAQKITTQKKVKSSGKTGIRPSAPVPPAAKSKAKAEQDFQSIVDQAQKTGSIDDAMRVLQAKRRMR